MQSVFSNALSEAVSKHIGLSATRRETLAWLVLLMMQRGTVCLWRLAAHVMSAAQTASVQRRFYLRIPTNSPGHSDFISPGIPR